jgi:sedoheptulose-bisphosphatase
MGYLIEKAGGKTSEGTQSVLKVPITETEQVSQVAFGSYKEVSRFEELVGKKFI